MTLTLEHQHQWCAEAGANLAETGRDHAPAPECPGTEWAEKARKRARRLTELAVAS